MRQPPLAAMRIEQCTREGVRDWAKLRHELWPHAAEAALHEEAAGLLESPQRAVAFLARSPTGEPVGFAEATLRSDHVNGCTTSPVAFLEGIYVRPEWRRQGIARRLCGAVVEWGVRRGCSELGSDALLHNRVSHHMHRALGFEETERVVFYRMPIPPA